MERRRRIAWAVFFGTVTGVLVFFWLHLPQDTRPIKAASVRPIATFTLDAGASPDAGAAATPQSSSSAGP